MNLQVGQEDKVSEVNTPWYWTSTLPDHALHITVSLSSCLGTEANAEYSPPPA